jgi:hypothetical protein
MDISNHLGPIVFGLQPACAHLYDGDPNLWDHIMLLTPMPVHPET